MSTPLRVGLQIDPAPYISLLSAYEGIVKITDRRLSSAFLHEAKPLKLRKAAIDNLPGFRKGSG